MNRAPSRLSTALALLLLAACGGDARHDAGNAEDAAAPAPAPAEAMASVTILEPAEGSEVGSSVLVRLQAAGVTIVPAGDMTPGTGHHHLYLDEDVAPAGAPVPTVPGHVVHLGTGVSEYTFEDVAPGAHRLIAVVADGAHVPLQPWVTDTVRFTVH